jgi:phosphoadenosine phosphosulfate reductase
MIPENFEKSLLLLPLAERLTQIVNHFEGKKIVFSSSFGQEDQAITHAIASQKLPVEIFTLDTGRQFQESYELIDLTVKKLGFNLKTYFPQTSAVEKLVETKGFNSFYASVENRKECCYIRKIEPLNRALQGAQVWITGLRAEQSENRADMHMIEWDAQKNLYKINPLIDWSFETLEKYLAEHKIPQNPLHKKGFISIGCAPCTRAIAEGEHPRAGRWWWENSQKECGLHA